MLVVLHLRRLGAARAPLGDVHQQLVWFQLLTANAGSDNQLLYRKEGFSGYLAKPVSGALLEAAVLSILPKELVRISEEIQQSDMTTIRFISLSSTTRMWASGASKLCR